MGERDPQDRDSVLALAMAIADGAPVEWPDGTFVTASGELRDRLRELEQLGRGYESLRSQAPDSQQSLGRHVPWGPLVILDKVGRGSFGDVYRAWDPRLEREVALKLIADKDDGTSVAVEEGRLLARVRHPHVLTVYGAERVDGRTGIWTEYLRGETLSDEVSRRGRLPAPEAARIGADVCAALGAVHAAGVRHGDVKAQNVMRDSTGRIVLGDFGAGAELAEDTTDAVPLMAGTPLYLAPEVLANRTATVATDLYSVGVLMYFLVTAEHPVRGRTVAEIKRAHATGDRVSLRQARPDLPEEFVTIVERLLAAAPEQRHASAGSAEAALRAWLDRLQREMTAQMTAVRPRRRVFRAAVGYAAAISACVAVVWTLWPAGVAQLDAGDWIVVGAFDNHTGEQILDDTIEALVKRELGYSDHVLVAQRDRIEDSLSLLERPLDSPLDRPLALELIARDGGIGALVRGEIRRAAGVYTVTSEIVNPVNDRSFLITEAAARSDDIVGAVRRLTLRVREALGERPESVESGRVPLARARLPSLKAVHLYARATRLMNLRVGDQPVELRSPGPAAVWQKQWAPIERLLRAALDDDPSFAPALTLLAFALSNQGRPKEEWRALAERAARLADAEPPQTRYFITASMHMMRAGARPETPNEREELELAIQDYEALLAVQPAHYESASNLRFAYNYLGRERDLVSLGLRTADARPRNAEVNFVVASRFLRQGNLEAALRYAARAESSMSGAWRAAGPDNAASVRLFAANIAWLENDPGRLLRLLDTVAATAQGLPEPERRQLNMRLWQLYANLGRLRQAERIVYTIRPSDPNDLYSFTADIAEAAFLNDAGRIDRLRELLVRRARDPLPADAPPYMGGRAVFLIEAGLLDLAERDNAWFKRRTKLSDFFLRPYLNGAARLELKRGRPTAAIALLRQSAAAPGPKLVAGAQALWAASTMAAALDDVGNRSEAIKVLEGAVSTRLSALDMPGDFSGIVYWMRASAQLAGLYRKAGHEEKARPIEDDLLKFLAFADSEYPLLQQIRAARDSVTALDASSNREPRTTNHQPLTTNHPPPATNHEPALVLTADTKVH